MGINPVAAGQKLTATMINQLPVVISYLSTGSVSNSNAETVVGTFTIPANDPTFPGGYEWISHATCTMTASPTLTVRLRLGGVAGTLLSSGTGTFSVTPGIFQFQGWLLMEATGAGGSFGGQSTVAVNFAGSPSSHIDQFEAVAINT